MAKGKKVDFYFEMEDFDGYDFEGLWADLKVDTAHLNDYGKMAMVGEKKWQEWAAKATDFFTGSEVRFFEPQQKVETKQWVAVTPEGGIYVKLQEPVDGQGILYLEDDNGDGSAEVKMGFGNYGVPVCFSTVMNYMPLPQRGIPI